KPERRAIGILLTFLDHVADNYKVKRRIGRELIEYFRGPFKNADDAAPVRILARAIDPYVHRRKLFIQEARQHAEGIRVTSPFTGLDQCWYLLAKNWTSAFGSQHNRKQLIVY